MWQLTDQSLDCLITPAPLAAETDIFALSVCILPKSYSQSQYSSRFPKMLQAEAGLSVPFYIP